MASLSLWPHGLRAAREAKPWGRESCGYVGSFGVQELLLTYRAAGVAGQRAVRADHSVTGTYHQQRVRAHRGADGPRRGCRSSDVCGDVAVAEGGAVRDFFQNPPHSLLEL